MPGKSALPSMSAVCAAMKVASALLEAWSASVRPCDASTANNTTRCDVKRRRPERLMSRLYTSPVTCGAALAVLPASADAPLLCAIKTPKTFFTGRRTTLVNAARVGLAQHDPYHAHLSGGARMNGRLFIAQGAGPHPTVVVARGMQDLLGSLDVAMALRRAGFNVLSFNYRRRPLSARCGPSTRCLHAMGRRGRGRRWHAGIRMHAGKPRWPQGRGQRHWRAWEASPSSAEARGQSAARQRR